MARENNKFKDGIDIHDLNDKLFAFPHANILRLALCVILNVMPVIQGETDKKEEESLINNMARTVIYIEYQREIAETTKVKIPQGEQEVILYSRVQGNQEYKPLVRLDVKYGTGFLVTHGDITYIVTARHVIEDPPGTISSKGIYLIPSEDKVIKGDFEELSKRISDAHWFLHKIADVTIHPFEFPAGTKIRYWRVPETFLTPEPRELLTSVIVPGFPGALGKDDENLGPVLAIRDIVSWPIPLPNFSKVPEEKYFLLNDRLAGGYSGSPVFTFREPPTKFVLGGHENKLAGIMSNVYATPSPNPIKGGVAFQDNWAAIVPTADLLGLFGYPEVIAFETSYLQKIRARKLSESQQRTDQKSPDDQKTSKGKQ